MFEMIHVNLKEWLACSRAAIRLAFLFIRSWKANLVYSLCLDNIIKIPSSCWPNKKAQIQVEELSRLIVMSWKPLMLLDRFENPWSCWHFPNGKSWCPTSHFNFFNFFNFFQVSIFQFFNFLIQSGDLLAFTRTGPVHARTCPVNARVSIALIHSTCLAGSSSSSRDSTSEFVGNWRCCQAWNWSAEAACRAEDRFWVRPLLPIFT